MTASKIAAVVGTSPYESRFSLWHKMHGDVEAGHITDNPILNYGHYLEPVLLRWFGDEHPELIVTTGEWTVRDGWAGATPDGRFVLGGLADDYPGSPAGGLVECKTSRLAWEWDDGVPPGYVDQCQWEMWVTGEAICYVVADVMMEFREYRVDRDDDRIAHLVAEARAFMDSLATGTPPPIDGSTHTYLAIRELHPDIDPLDIDVPGDLAWAWLEAHHAAARWADLEAQAKNNIADLMGTARRAMFDGRPLFTRQARNGGTPYLVAGRNLPTASETAA